MFNVKVLLNYTLLCFIFYSFRPELFLEAAQKEMNFCCFTPSTKSKFSVILVLIQLCFNCKTNLQGWKKLSTFPEPFLVTQYRGPSMERFSVGEDHFFWCPMFLFCGRNFICPDKSFGKKQVVRTYIWFISKTSQKTNLHGATFLFVFILARCLIGHYIQTLTGYLSVELRSGCSPF